MGTKKTARLTKNIFTLAKNLKSSARRKKLETVGGNRAGIVLKYNMGTLKKVMCMLLTTQNLNAFTLYAFRNIYLGES